jgi:CRISPR-associated endonuclease/helicase Cas3
MDLQQAENFFVEAFKTLVGFPPLRWQKRLFHRFVKNQIPDACSLPTGLGKTSVIAIWLIALAYQAESGSPALPRRLFYVVNRRTVVDQATEICVRIRQQLEQNDSSVVARIKEALGALAAVPGLPVVGISTLRGELADNEEWKLDPCRPAIVVGTIDMIGSKLIFSGYGDSYKMRAFHAGLVGQDALIVHDEAHLAPAFSDLLRAVEQHQKSGKVFKPFKVFQLSATLTEKANKDIFSLEDEDKKDEFVQCRLNAKKCCTLEIIEDSTTLEEKIAELALNYQDQKAKVLIYVHSPTSVRNIADQIAKKIGDKAKERVTSLTGTLRGFERDQMLRSSSIYRAFLNSENVEQSIYLVANAAGEVGLDLDADHMICDLQTADRFIQRLGRVNRRGGEGDSRVHVVYKPEKTREGTANQSEQGKKKQREKKKEESPTTLVLKKLEELKSQSEDGTFNMSPNALSSIQFPPQAFDASPAALRLDAPTLDRWSATTIPHREDISAYLHGLEREPPETFVAWRAEVDKLVAAVSQMSDEEDKAETLKQWFEIAPIRSHERLRESSSNAHDMLKKIAEKNENRHAVFILANGEVKAKRIADILDKSEIYYATVVLSPSYGGLDSQGLLDPASTQPVSDVLQEVGAENACVRFLVRWDADREVWQLGQWDKDQVEWAYEDLPEQTTSWDVNEAAEHALSKLSESLKRDLRIALFLPTRYEASQQEEDWVCHEALVLAVSKSGKAQQVETLAYDQPPTVDAHCKLAEQWAGVLASKLGLPKDIAEALKCAAKYHDMGKARLIWQRAVFNTGFPQQPAWAKSGRLGMDARRLRGYRHELGSLIEAQEKEKIKAQEKYLALHLIAAHHGWSRPLFRKSALDIENGEEVNRNHILEAALRFERLQRQYGWWALAWLEGLIHITDVLASNECQPNMED